MENRGWNPYEHMLTHFGNSYYNVVLKKKRVFTSFTALRLLLSVVSMRRDEGFSFISFETRCRMYWCSSLFIVRNGGSDLSAIFKDYTYRELSFIKIRTYKSGTVHGFLRRAVALVGAIRFYIFRCKAFFNLLRRKLERKIKCWAPRGTRALITSCTRGSSKISKWR